MELVGVSEAEEHSLLADNRRDSRVTSEKLIQDLQMEEEEVIFKMINVPNAKGPGESQRATLLYISLWETSHARSRVLHLPKDTLYTASIAMPMVARSSGYTLTLTATAVKMVLLTFGCIALQSSLISSFYHARTRLPGLDGVPSMCTYGQDVGADHVPYGPTGLPFAKDYKNMETDYTRIMVRNTLAEVLNKTHEKYGIESDVIGPVEYAMENATCRFVCLLVFTVGIFADLISMEANLRFLYYSPTTTGWSAHSYKDKWVGFDDASFTPKFEDVWRIAGKSRLDHIWFRCGGMPLAWKIFCLLLSLARFMVILATFWNGLSFLMNTGKILDLILNSLALTFIVELDTIIFQTFARGVTKDIIERLEPYRVMPELGELQADLKARGESEVNWGAKELLQRFVKSNVAGLALLFITIAGHFAYFYRHCVMEVAPFNFHEFGKASYYAGQTRFFGGFQFFLGSWSSADTVDYFSHTVTCHPAYHDKGSDPEGCGIPNKWSMLSHVS